MANILVKLAEATTRTLASSKMGGRMLAFYSESGNLLFKAEAGTLYDFLSKQYLENSANNAAGSIGVQWGGSADNVQEALDEILSRLSSVEGSVSLALNPRGPWSSGEDYSPLDLVSYDGNTYLCFSSITNSTTSPDLDTAHFALFADGATSHPEGEVSYGTGTGADTSDPGFTYKTESALTGTDQKTVVLSNTGSTAESLVEVGVVSATSGAQPVMAVIDVTEATNDIPSFLQTNSVLLGTFSASVRKRLVSWIDRVGAFSSIFRKGLAAGWGLTGVGLNNTLLSLGRTLGTGLGNSHLEIFRYGGADVSKPGYKDTDISVMVGSDNNNEGDVTILQLSQLLHAGNIVAGSNITIEFSEGGYLGHPQVVISATGGGSGDPRHIIVSTPAELKDALTLAYDVKVIHVLAGSSLLTPASLGEAGPNLTIEVYGVNLLDSVGLGTLWSGTTPTDRVFLTKASGAPTAAIHDGTQSAMFASGLTLTDVTYQARVLASTGYDIDPSATLVKVGLSTLNYEVKSNVASVWTNATQAWWYDVPLSWKFVTADGEAHVLTPYEDSNTVLIGDADDYDSEDSGKLVIIPNDTTSDDIIVVGSMGGEADGTYVLGGVDVNGFQYWHSAGLGLYISHSDSLTAPWYCISASLNPVYYEALYTNYAVEQQPLGTYTGNGGRAFYTPEVTQYGEASGVAVRGYGLSKFDSLLVKVAAFVKRIVPVALTAAEEETLSHIEGAMHYNGEEKAWKILGVEAGNAMSVGQEFWTPYCKNVDSVPITNGQIVRIYDYQGSHPTVKLAQADDHSEVESVIGMCTVSSVAVNGWGFFTVFGMVNGLDTDGLTSGVPVYLSADTAGGWTTTPPEAPNYLKPMGLVMYPHSTQGSIFVNALAQPNHLADLHDVRDGSAWTYSTVVNMVCQAIGSRTKEVNGFDTTESKMQDRLQYLFQPSDGTGGIGLFTIQPRAPYTDYSFDFRGKRFTKSTSLSIDIPTTNKKYWVVFNSDGNLEVIDSATTYDIIRDYVFVAEWVWNKTRTRVMRASYECHGQMPWEAHLWAHNNLKTQWTNGLLVQPTIGGQNLAWSLGNIADEDIPWTIQARSASTNMAQSIFRNGATAEWDDDYAASGVRVGAGGRPVYNHDTGGGVWGDTEIQANKFMCIHAFAACEDDAGNPVAILNGTSEYNSAAAAYAGARTELLSIDLTGLPAAEYRLLATMVVQASANSWAWSYVDADGDEIIDWRANTPVALGGLGDFLSKLENEWESQFSLKATPADDDLVLIEDSEDGYAKKKVLVSSLSGSSGMTNPMTSVGDLIVGTTAGAPSRLGIGTVGKVLTSTGTTAAWSDLPTSTGVPFFTQTQDLSTAARWYRMGYISSKGTFIFSIGSSGVNLKAAISYVTSQEGDITLLTLSQHSSLYITKLKLVDNVLWFYCTTALTAVTTTVLGIEGAVNWVWQTPTPTSTEPTGTINTLADFSDGKLVSTSKMKTPATSAGDASTTLATKGYVDSVAEGSFAMETFKGDAFSTTLTVAAYGTGGYFGRFLCTASGTINKVGTDVLEVPTGDTYQFAIYDDAMARLGFANVTVSATGKVSATLSAGVSVTAGNYYWLFINCKGTTGNIKIPKIAVTNTSPLQGRVQRLVYVGTEDAPATGPNSNNSDGNLPYLFAST